MTVHCEAKAREEKSVFAETRLNTFCDEHLMGGDEKYLGNIKNEAFYWMCQQRVRVKLNLEYKY